MKKIVVIIACILLGMVGFIGYKTINPTPITLNPFENLVVKQSGYNGEGKIELDTSKIKYPDKNYISNFTKTIKYHVYPDKNLSNGEKVKIYITYDKNYAKKKNISIAKKSKTIKIKKLKEGYEIYKGLQVPRGLSKEEKEELYKTQMAPSIKEEENHGAEDANISVTEEEETYQGKLQTETHKKNKTFDYFNDAYNYGLQSSQKFRVDTVSENLEMKFQCTFLD